MTIELEDGGSLQPGYDEALHAGLAAVGADHARVVVSGVFDTTVGRLIGHHTYAEDRGAGAVTARTLADPAATIVVNQRAVETQELTVDDLERIAAHEGGHVLMNDREEGLGWHQDLATDQVSFHLLTIAAGVIEEYRCEAALAARRTYPAMRGRRAVDLAGNLHDANVAFLGAVSDEESADPAVLHHRIVDGVVTPLSKTLAVTLAGTIGGADEVAGLVGDREDWRDYVEPTWARRTQFLAGLPTATEPMARDAYRDALQEGARIEAAFLRDVGFEYLSDDQGWGFVRVVADERCAERLDRALRIDRLRAAGK